MSSWHSDWHRGLEASCCLLLPAAAACSHTAQHLARTCCEALPGCPPVRRGDRSSSLRPFLACYRGALRPGAATIGCPASAVHNTNDFTMFCPAKANVFKLSILKVCNL